MYIILLNMKKKIILLFYLLVCFNAFSKDLLADQESYIDAIEIIKRSENSFEIMSKNKELKNFPKFFNESKAVLIFPEVYEGGLLFGAKGGNGMLMIRKQGVWSGPFFYTIGGVSLGIQIGVKKGRVIFTVMTEKGLKSILKERVKFGVDVDAAIASQGIGLSAESTIRLADVFSFTDNKGLFIGTSLEGTYLQPRNDLNKAIHGKSISPTEILSKVYDHKEITRLVQKLARQLP